MATMAKGGIIMGRHGSDCAPNCGQVVIHNQGGTVIININCCSGTVPFSVEKEEQ